MRTWSDTDEETGLWVIIDHFPNSPSHTYGFFDTEAEARTYADQQGKGAMVVRMTYTWCSMHICK